MQRRNIVRIITIALLCSSISITGLVTPILGDSNAIFTIEGSDSMNISLSFDINRIVNVNNNTLAINLYDLVEDAYINDSTDFYDAILLELNQSLITENLALSELEIVMNSMDKKIQLIYTVRGIVSEHIIRQSNITRAFNPVTFLIDIVNRSSTVVSTNTYFLDLDWLDKGFSGFYSKNFTQGSSNFTYTFNFGSLFYYQPLGTIRIDQWNQTGNTFSAFINYTFSDEPYYLLGEIIFPTEARGVFAIENGIIFHVSEGISTPLLFGLLGIGAVLIIGGGLLHMFTQEKESVQTQPIQEKWRKRKRKRKRK